MESISSIKTELEDFGVEFEVLLAEDIQLPQESKIEMELAIREIDQELAVKQKVLASGFLWE